MPYYRITIKTKEGKLYRGIKEDVIQDIDVYFRKMEQKAIMTFKNNLVSFEAVMLSKHSKELEQHLTRPYK